MTTTRYRLAIVTFLTIVLLTSVRAFAQRGEPHVGYVYPAGVARGETVEVTIGGQFLQGASGARLTGDGLDIEVVKYYPALNRGQTIRLFQMIRQLKEQRDGKTGGKDKGKENPKTNGKPNDADDAKRKRAAALENVTPESILAEARKFGLEVNNVFDLVKILRKRQDPKFQPSDQIDERVILKISAAPDAPAGTRELRLVTPQGQTNALVFHVGAHREWTEDEPDGGAGEVKIEGGLPLVINGQVMPGDVDRFCFRAAKGDKLVASVAARELVPYLADAVPGWFQATLVLYDAEGRQVAFCDDYRFRPDPVIFYDVPADGDYVLEIADAIYRGRDDFVYRITLGETPFITGLYPMGGRAGEQTTVRLTGYNLPRTELTIDPAAARGGVMPVSIESGGMVSNIVPFAVGSLDEAFEREPNDDAAQAQRIAWPVVVNGRIDRPGDRDVLRIEGRPGETVVVEVDARRLGSPLDSLVMVTGSEGKLLAASDDCEDKGRGRITHHADSRLTFVLPAEGVCLVHIADAQDAGGPDYAYRLRIDRPHPGFDLRATPANLNVPPGGVAEVTVHALRRDGFAGDIVLLAGGLPEGFKVSGGRIPAGCDSVRMTLYAPAPKRKDDIESYSFPLTIEGLATIDGQKVRQTAVAAEDQMQAFLWRFLVPMEEGVVTVAGRRRWMPPISFDPAPVTIPAGGTAQVKVSGPRGFFLKQLDLELDNPPAGVTIQKFETDPREGITLTLAAGAEALKSAAEGNLIVSIFTKPPEKNRDGKPARNRPRIKVGIMPALPYKVVRGQ